MKFQVGDLIKCHESHAQGVIREIVEVRDTGYTWRYPDLPEAGQWDTENSSDPMLDLGWRRLMEGGARSIA